MALFKPKDHIPLGEAVARLGRDLYPNAWTGDEFLPAFATMAGIASDTDDYLIGWVARHCDTKDETNKKPRKTKAKKTRKKRALLSVATTKRWNRATEVYRIAQGMLDGTVSEWPKDFPLGPDDLDTLEAEATAFRAPRLAAHNRALKAIQRMRRELYGTPPDCKDAIPALRCSPDKPPSLVDCEFWFGPDGLDRLRHAVQADCGEQGSSRIVVPLKCVDAVCRLLEPEEEEQPKAPAEGHHRPGRPAPQSDVVDPKDEAAGVAGRPSLRTEIENACRELISNGTANLDSRKPNYEPIRQIIRRERGLPPGDDVAGLGDEAIRKVIAPILDNALAELNEAKKRVP